MVASAATTVVFYSFVPSWNAAVACFLSGILLDVDHFIDFYLRKKKALPAYEELVRFCMEEKEGRIYLVLHSYELTLLLWVSAFFFPNLVWIGFLFGMTVHLLLDQFFNDIHPLAYFWVYRAHYKFPHKVFFYKDFIKEYKKEL